MPFLSEAVKSPGRRARRQAAHRVRRRARSRSPPTSIEGGPSKNHDRTRALMYGDPELWHALMGRLAGHRGRVPAGAGRGRGVRGAAVRLVGRRASAPRTTGTPSCRTPARIFSALAAVRRAAHSLRRRAPASCSACSARRAPTWSASTGGSRSTRPRAGSAPRHARCRATSTRRCCCAGWDGGRAARPRDPRRAPGTLGGHVFNLGHGVPPETDPDVLARLTDLVHEVSAAAA